MKKLSAVIAAVARLAVNGASFRCGGSVGTHGRDLINSTPLLAVNVHP